MIEAQWPPNWPETINRFVFNRDVRGAAREILYHIRTPHGLTPYRLWGFVESSAEVDKGALAAFYLFDLDSVLVDHNIAAGERARLRTLRSLLRLEEGDLLRDQRAEVERMVVEEIGEILQDDLVDPAEALRQVDLQEALGLSYDAYSQLGASVIESKIKPWLQEARGPLTVDLQRRLVALDSLIRLPPELAPRPDPNPMAP